ncbi:Golgi to ER traffic protein 4 [Ceratobasidium sp. AG-Ba]|nr:Golgi to ER traffic protein 4 [Ceratobasidium sp. AG-Ba]
MPPAPSSARALQAILPQIAENKPYEAHQKARTFVSRYVKSGQHDVAIDVLFQSARELLKAGHMGSGVDLGSFLLDVYDTAKVEVNSESRGRMTQLIALTGSEGAWRKTLIDKTVAWSAKRGKCPAGDPELLHYCGELLYREGSFEAAEVHLLNSASRDSARLLAQMMFEWSRDGANPGAYAIRGTIPYLLNTSILAARTFLTTFLGLLLASPRKDSLINSHFPNPIPLNSPNSEQDEIQITTDPTLNFLQLAIQTCQRAGWGTEATTTEEETQNRASRDAWLRLAARYRTRVVGGETTRDAIESLGSLYFDLPSARKGANPLQDMMSSLFGGGEPTESRPARKLRRALPSAGLD